MYQPAVLVVIVPSEAPRIGACTLVVGLHARVPQPFGEHVHTPGQSAVGQAARSGDDRGPVSAEPLRHLPHPAGHGVGSRLAPQLRDPAVHDGSERVRGGHHELLGSIVLDVSSQDDLDID